jgi:hypothetical protein
VVPNALATSLAPMPNAYRNPGIKQRYNSSVVIKNY